MVGTNAPLSEEQNSWGLAGQMGVDIKAAPNWFVNLDVKYVQIQADDIRVSGATLAAGTKVTDLDVNPWLLSVGVGVGY